MRPQALGAVGKRLHRFLLGPEALLCQLQAPCSHRGRERGPVPCLPPTGKSFLSPHTRASALQRASGSAFTNGPRNQNAASGVLNDDRKTRNFQGKGNFSRGLIFLKSKNVTVNSLQTAKWGSAARAAPHGCASTSPVRIPMLAVLRALSSLRRWR